MENILDNSFAKNAKKKYLIYHLKCGIDIITHLKKYTLRDKNNFPENYKILFDILTSQEILNILSNIVSEELYNVPINLEKDNLRLLRADPNKCINIYNTNK